MGNADRIVRGGTPAGGRLGLKRAFLASSCSAVMALQCVFAPSAHAQAARPESISHATVSVEAGCPITEPRATADPQTDRFLGSLIGTLFAGVAGNLVTSGLNAIGDALEQASREKAFVAEGTSSFNFYTIEQTGNPKAWSIQPDLVSADTHGNELSRCLIIALSPSASSNRAPSLDESWIRDQFTQVPGITARASGAARRLSELGLGKAPTLYLEAELVRAADGFVVQPVLLWYSERLPGAPSSTAASELHVSFATPGGADTSDIGSVFALARIRLPDVTPGNTRGENPTLLLRNALLSYAGVVVPLRPTAGTPTEELQRRTSVRSEVNSKLAEVAQLLATERVALRSVNQNTTPAQRIPLQNALEDTRYALEATQRRLQTLRQLDDALKASTAGSTNVKARFVVIRDADKFGLALAKALKAQAEATGTAVTNELTPQDNPAWAANDTALVNAQVDVRAAQRALDTAIANGETAKIPALQDAVLKAQAAANQAASAADRPLPYVIVP